LPGASSPSEDRRAQELQTGESNQAPVAVAATPRVGSKQALIIGMLSRGESATIGALIEATGWLPHTTRAAVDRDAQAQLFQRAKPGRCKGVALSHRRSLEAERWGLIDRSPARGRRRRPTRISTPNSPASPRWALRSCERRGGPSPRRSAEGTVFDGFALGGILN
jgi:hypothetical protein